MAKSVKAQGTQLAAAYFKRLTVNEYGDEDTLDVSSVYVDTLENIKAVVEKAEALAPELHTEGDTSWSVRYFTITPELNAAALLRDVQDLQED
jgi:hypothetical protein